MFNNVNICSDKPSNPQVGDVYYDTSSLTTRIYDNNNWTVFAADKTDVYTKDLEQKAQDLEKYLKYKNIDISDLDDFLNSANVARKLGELE